MRLLFLFLDGVGLGAADDQINPFQVANMPALQTLLEGSKFTLAALEGKPGLETARASLLALDASLGVDGLPQSATGQAVLLTGKNIPAEIGYHYGPKPNPEVAAYLRNGNIFTTLRKDGYRAVLINAYPPRYFEAIASGRRIFSSIPLAVTSAGISLFNSTDLAAGRALSADFTGRGWREQLGLPDVPELSPEQAGRRLAELCLGYDLTFFEYWLSDYAGHQQEMETAVELLQNFDRVLGGLLQSWQDDQGLILLTSDHGNLEDLGTRRHTFNPVPGLLVGAPELRHKFISAMPHSGSILGVAPAVLSFLGSGFSA
jgi:2,3-bisphosphoglycerate-independent phosphoglycerate mutase